ncbi:uncharacterized protein LOC107046632 [Diachasma alloeum]|uniref:uncharacterized protein LOC107046632 n=1 Tax=Diachasma alloeum TaxID=454923 RepID=UPI00073838D0|nr:uncharacterized protein LOC107046632 [Diachasma alloeum]
MQEVKLALKHAKNGKTHGPDGIANEFLKNMPIAWVEFLRDLLNKTWMEKNVPEDWPTAAVSMLYKKQKGSYAKSRLDFVDFKRAFDSVPHRRLWRTLFIAYVADMSFQEQNTVQGLDIGGKNLRTLLYADDTIIFARSYQEAQFCLRILADYFVQNSLTVHTGKTEILVCRTSGRIRKFEKEAFYYKGQPVKTVKEYTYLGTPVDYAMQGDAPVKSAIQRAKSAIRAASSILRRARADDVDYRIRIFDSLVASTLLYGVQVWGPGKLDAIEKIQTDFYRQIFLLPNDIPGYLIRLELDLLPLAARALGLIWDWTIKMLTMSPNRWPRIWLVEVIKLARSPACRPEYNWVAKLDQIFSSVGLESMFDNTDPVFWLARKHDFLDAISARCRSEDFDRYLCSSSIQTQHIRCL